MVKILLSVLLLFYPLISPAVSDECQNIARQAYFYSAPDSRCKSKNSFLIKGDSVIGYQTAGDYLFGGYINSDGELIDGWLVLSQLTETNLRISPLAEEVDYVNRKPKKKTDNPLPDEDYQLMTGKMILRPGEPVSQLRSDILKYYSQEPETVFIGYSKNGRTLGVDYPDPAVSVYISDGVNDKIDEEVISRTSNVKQIALLSVVTMFCSTANRVISPM